MSTQISDEIRAMFKNVGLSEVEQNALSHFLHGLREKDADKIEQKREKLGSAIDSCMNQYLWTLADLPSSSSAECGAVLLHSDKDLTVYVDKDMVQYKSTFEKVIKEYKASRGAAISAAVPDIDLS